MEQQIEVSTRPLAELEAVIERGLGTFVEVGQALLEIRDGRKYLETHLTFQDYCRERWGFSRPRAYELMAAAEVTKHLSGIPDTQVPSNAGQAAELSRLKAEPEAVREVWAEVKQEHGDSVTAADVRQAVDRRLGVERSLFNCSGCPESFTERVWHCNGCGNHWALKQPCGECLPEGGYAEPIADAQGVEHAAYPMPMPEPISDDDVIEAAGGDDGSIARARLLSQYSAGIVAAAKLIFLDAGAVVGALSRERRLIHRENARNLRAWLDRIEAEMSRSEDRPLQIVGGNRG